MDEKHECGTCKHDETGWLCDKCKDNNMWERRNDYEEEPEEPRVESGTTIVLKIMDESAMALANTIRKYVSVKIDDVEIALIFLEELTEHVDAYVRAERRWLEYQKSKEE